MGSDEIFMQHSLQFAESLKELKNLRKQLYSAAEYFESSHDKDDHQQLVIESSKDYVSKALVSTVDHLGSLADKLNKLLDKKTNEFSATNVRFSCIQQRLRTLQGLNELRGISLSGEWLIIEAPKHNKQYSVQDTECCETGKSKWIYRNCSMAYEMRQSQSQSQSQQDNPSFQVAGIQPQLSLLRLGSSPNRLGFSYTSVTSKKETVSAPLKRSGSLCASFSPASSHNKHRSPSVPRRAIISDMTKKEREIGKSSYTKRGRHLFKALFRSTRGIIRKDRQTVQSVPVFSFRTYIVIPFEKPLCRL